MNSIQAVGRPSRYGVGRCIPACGRTPNQRLTFSGRKGQIPYRGDRTWRSSNSQISERCTRCNSIYHSAERCFAIQMVCYNCGEIGHLLRACKLPMAPRNRQITAGRNLGNEQLEVAVVDTGVGTKPEIHVEEENAIIPASDVSS